MDRKAPDQSGREGSRSARVMEPRTEAAPGNALVPPAARLTGSTAATPGSGSPAGVIAPPRPPQRLAAAGRRLPWLRRLAGRAAARELAVLLAYLAAGVAVTWPRATYLAGHLPALRDDSGYVWGFWWVAQQAVHLGNPWYTNHMAAPLGSWLGYHTLMPLPGLLLAPVTLALGPSVSYNLLSVACPGLLSYATYRVARLWLPSVAGSLTAGAFFGLSTILDWRSWYQVNLAIGAVFFPLVLEAAVRLRRNPRPRQAVVLGAVLAAALLTDQESAVMAGMLATLALLPWLGLPPASRLALPRLPWPWPWPQRQPLRAAGPGGSWLHRLALAAAAVATAVLLASPQLLAMSHQGSNGEAASAPQIAASDYVGSGAGLLQLFAPSPRLASYGLAPLTSPYSSGGPVNLVMVGYGSVLTALALLGLVVAWRRRSARLLGLLWAGCSVLALGTAPWVAGRRWLFLPQTWHGVWVSGLMPFTWFVRVPGLMEFREADRFTELGLVGAALLAGAGISWLAARSRPALAVAVMLGLLEAGWPGNTAPAIRIGEIPTALPALDRPIAADHSGSTVVDVPFGIRGGLPVLGGAFPPITMTLATADGHPRGEAFISRIPGRVRDRIQQIPFYAALLQAQGGPLAATRVSIRRAGMSARHLHIGWIIDWIPSDAVVATYLREIGFQLSYRADGAAVYRPEPRWLRDRGWLQVIRHEAHYQAPVLHQRRPRQRDHASARAGRHRA